MAEAQSPRKLPPTILFNNILPRLPGKSLLRFKCVSKKWHSFLKPPLFAQMQLHHATNNHHQTNLKFLGFSPKTPNIFNTIDCEGGLLSATRPLPFKVSGRNKMTVLASFGGLVCVGITKCGYLTKYTDLILWNPLTGEYKTLSKTNSRKNCYKKYDQTAFGLYYSSCDDDFKLLRVTYDLNAYIYSLKWDTWKRVDSTKDLKAYPCRPYCLWPSVALNEKLYFLKLGHNSTRNSIIRFDTKTEKFIEIATPCLHLFTEIANRNDVFLSLVVLKGCIHFFVIYCSSSHLELQNVDCWWMDADGKWIQEVTLPKASYIIIETLHALSKGEQLTGSSSDGRAWKLDLTRHVINDITWLYTPDRSIYIPERGKYIETLVSPNHR